MSEEGEANFDAGQLPESTPAAPVPPPPATTRPPSSASASRPAQDTGEPSMASDNNGDSRSVRSSSRRGEYSSRYPGYPPRSPGQGWAARPDDDYYRRENRSRSRSGERDASRRPYYDAPRRDGYRQEEEYRGGYSGRRYNDREYPPRYYKRYERDPGRYRRREPGRYFRGGYAREEPDGEDLARRDMDKERAIEELRSRVRARGGEREEPAGPPPPPVQSTPLQTTVADTAVSSTVDKPDVATVAPMVAPDPAIEPGQAVDPDDLEEGEHIEGVADVEPPKPAKPEYSAHASGLDRDRSRSQSRYSRDPMFSARSHSRERAAFRDRSRSRSRYGEFESQDPGRRGPGYREYERSRRYEEYPDRRDYRGSRYYGSRYERGYPSRYAGGAPRSPEPYRSDRRHYSGRYERYDAGGARSPAERIGSPVRRSQSREASLSRSRPPRPADYADPRGPSPVRQMPRSISRSRSPGVYRRNTDDYNRHGYADSPSRSAIAVDDASNPPPPPPPMVPHSQSMHGQSGSYPDAPYRSYSSRNLRRQAGTPYNSRYEYDGQPPPPRHGRQQSMGSVPYQNGYPQPREQSPGLAAISQPNAGHYAVQQPVQQQQQNIQPPPPPPEPTRVGSDLCIARGADTAEWLEAREKAREQAKRVQELTAATRRTGFELAYSNWGVQKADGQMQLANWHLERAEQGLNAAVDELIGEDMMGDI
ncbi:hypothetical protein FBU59_002998 [Linderina macrospora]|uniref:Uncharacterized protein n=1 Tax=Linderina macrospora TaxID=4868 RepID=A0ACC1J9G8_9FUNG|nr:hypothetical protein FBU59_002998 [Linderina macrospora]